MIVEAELGSRVMNPSLDFSILRSGIRYTVAALIHVSGFRTWKDLEETGRHRIDCRCTGDPVTYFLECKSCIIHRITGFAFRNG